MARPRKQEQVEQPEPQTEDGEGGAGAIDEVEWFGTKQARWYQIAARNEVAELLEQGLSRICVVAPTGSGKTLTSGLIFSSDRIRKALGVKKGQPLGLSYIAHKHRLLSQAERVYAEAENIKLMLHSCFTPIPEDAINKTHVFCLDEAHHEAMMSIQLQLERIAHIPIIGLTATPDRADGALIKFEEIVAPISREQAVAEGWLAPTQLYSFVDAPAKDKTQIICDVLDNYHHLMGQTMLFVRTKAEVARVHDYVTRNLKLKARAITNQTDAEVDRLLDQFSSKKFQFIINCNKINEGVDVSFCESVFLGRQFGSYPQLNQVIGRASRPDSDCRVWELINCLSGRNLDTTVVVGTPELHKLVYRKNGKWIEEQFDYSSELVVDPATLQQQIAMQQQAA